MMACTLSDLPDEPPLATELPCDPEEIRWISNRFGSWTDDSGKAAVPRRDRLLSL